MSPKVKKLVSVSAIFTPVTRSRAQTVETVKAIEAAEAVEAAKAVETAEAVGTAKVGKNGDENESEYPNLAQVPYIRYTITFRKKSVLMLALLDSGSEVNAIQPTFA